MARKDLGDIATARLSNQALADGFSDACPALDRQSALLEAQRCYYCYDAPCITACPTGIDIPSFIRRISNDHLHGAAVDILSANIMGGMCARVCPTEILCEGSCVRNIDSGKPVEIGALQRYATDWVYETNTTLFERAPNTGRTVAIVGAGPAGLACAHALAQRGHRVTVYDAHNKAGGLNEYGIAAYKVLDFAQREIEWLLSIGGIDIVTSRTLGKDLRLSQLRQDFDAVFLAVGLGGVNTLALDGENLSGVRNAVDFIAELRQCTDLRKMPIGRRVVVIGGGNTAIDAAVQSKKLGAEWVSLVYRRDAASMSATVAEQAFAKEAGVQIVHWAQPMRLLSQAGVLSGVEFEHTQLDSNQKLVGTGDHFTLAADQVLKAIGQILVSDPLHDTGHEMLELRKGRIVVNTDYATSLSGVWAGGDCVGGHIDLTVQAVEDGKRAALSIDRALAAKAHHSA